MSEAPTRKTRCGRCHRARLVYKVDGLLGWVELCHACREELHIAALSAARDEVVRAAVALDAAFTDHETPTDAWSLVAARKLAWADHRAAVAALARLEKP